MLTAFFFVSLAAVLIFFALGGGGTLRLLWQEPIGVAVPLVACMIVLAVPQMADMMVGMKSGYGAAGGHDDVWWHQTGLGFAVLALGVQSWFWTRAALNARHGFRDADAPKGLPWQEIWAPRLTLIPTTLIALSPLFMAMDGTIPTTSIPWTGVLSAVAACFIVGSLAWLRRYRHNRRMPKYPATSDTATQVEHAGATPLASVAVPVRSVTGGSGDQANTVERGLAGTTPEPKQLSGSRIRKLLAAAPYGPRMAWLLLLISLAGTVSAQLFPEFINDHLHTPTAALLGMSCIVPVGSIALALLRDFFEWILHGIRNHIGTEPHDLSHVADGLGLAAVVALPIGLSYIAQSYTGLYDVRRTDAGVSLIESRKDVKAAAAQYAQCHVGESGRIPAIIVVSEGGASRSAVWTLSVMRMLDSRTGGFFGSHLFAITGVSGGSLAAMTYQLAQSAYLPGTDKAATPGQQLAFWEKTLPGVVELGRSDLLSSSVSRMFTSDVMFGVPRRGPALEQAFEHYWNLRFDLPDPAGMGFLAARAQHPCLPHLLLQGTDVASGARLLTSTLQFPENGGPFPAAVDVFSGQDRDIAASAAVLNSARFPLISPPGRLSRNGSKKPQELMVIDGGVFENYGARTAWELVRAFQDDPVTKNRLEPVVVLISNDAEETPLTCSKPADNLNMDSFAATPPGKSPGGIRVPELLMSLLGLYNTRGGHGRGEIGMLHQQLCGQQTGSLFHFDLPKPDVSLGQSAPMNWVLDSSSCKFMLGKARSLGTNPGEADALRAFLLKRGMTQADMREEAEADWKRCEGDGLADLVKEATAR